MDKSNINNIIEKLSKSKELDEILKNVQSELEEIKSNSDESSNISHCDIKLGGFFLDKDGNNICDCLNNINNNLQKIVNYLENRG